MPLTPQRIAERLGHISFPFADDTVHVDYRAARVDAITQEQVTEWFAEAEKMTDEEGAALMADLVATHVASWDVVESVGEDGTLGPMVPLTVERLKDLDPTFLVQVFMRVVMHANEGKGGGTASPKPTDGGSSKA